MIGKSCGKASAGLAIVACMVSTTGHAHAAIGSDQVNATGACNGALPAFETVLRKRPLAIANEGDATAFVSCSLQTSGIDNFGYFDVVLVLVNRGTQSAAASCTLVTGGSGVIGLGSPAFFPQATEVPANSVRDLRWFADDLGVESFDVLVNFTCALPPNLEIGSIGGAYNDAP